MTGIRESSEQAGAQIGRYKLLEQIGEGGMGTIWMAEQREPVKRRVALKIIKLGMDTKQVIARFEAERQALAMMDHPHIAKVLDAGATETGRPYFVMEYIKGVPILEYCDHAQLDTKARLELFTSVCHAIQHAHHKGIIHRDIKPSNVLVTLHDGVPVPKVIDFGIAKATNAELTTKTLFTEHRQMIGTPAYMSPEQAEMSGLDIDTRSDVYSLGVLLYELLTGTTPFDMKALLESGFNEMLRAIREDEPHKPSTRISTLGETGTRTALQRKIDLKKLSALLRGDLDWIVMKCLEKDRSRRYDTANGLAADIKLHLAGDAVLAAPPSASYRARKFARRHRVQVAAAGLITIALLLGLAGTVWQANVASERADAAKKSEVEAKTARDAEKTRADELEQVSRFQEKMLAQVDPTTAGVRLTEDVNRRYSAALAKAKVPEAERAGLERAFRQSWAKVNATDAAAALIDATILKPAAAAIAEQFKDQPIVGAQLRQALADRYRDLGLYESALLLQRSALETRRRELGEEREETLRSIGQMGSLLLHLGKLDEAEPYVREAVEQSRRVLGEQNLNTLICLNNLAKLFQAQGKLDEAESCLRETIEKCRASVGEEHSFTLSTITNLATVLQLEGKFDEAEPLFRDALQTLRRVQGQDHPDTIHALVGAGGVLWTQGKLDEAEPLYREALEKTRRVMGEQHPVTLIAICNMGALLQDQGQLDEAEPYVRDALEKTRRAQGEDHPETIACLNNMGTFFEKKGQNVECEQYHRERLERCRRVLGDAHPDTIDACNKVGRALQRQGKIAESEPVLGEGVAACRRAYSSPHPTTATLLHHHADALRAVGRLDDAAAQAREAMGLYLDHPTWSADEGLHATNILKSILTAQGQPEEAIAVGREWLAVQRQTLPPGSAELGPLLASFGLELLTRGTLDAAREAEPLVRECLEIRARTMPEDWRTSNTRSMLGAIVLIIAERDSEQTPEARGARMRESETLLLEGYSELQEREAAIPPASKVRIAQALERVAHLYEVWDEAEPLKGYDAKSSEWKAKLPSAPVEQGDRR